MTDTIQFHRATRGDLEKVYQFHYKYTEDTRSRYVWNWEYGDLNSFKTDLVIGCDGESVVATQGVMEIPLIFGSERIMSGKNESLLIDKEYRKKGLSGRLYDYALDVYKSTGYAFLWGFSRKALPTLKNADFLTFRRPMSRAILPLDFKMTFSLLFSDKKASRLVFYKCLLLLAITYSRIVWGIGKALFPIRNSHSLQILERLTNDDDLHVYINSMSKLHPNMVFIDQDSKYLQWRLQDSPIPIQSIYLYSEGKIVGYMHLGIRDYGFEILDLLSNSAKETHILIDRARSMSIKNGFGLILYTGNRYNRISNGILTLLRSSGYWIMPGVNDFVIRFFDRTSIAPLSEISNWYMTGIWFEGI